MASETVLAATISNLQLQDPSLEVGSSSVQSTAALVQHPASEQFSRAVEVQNCPSPEHHDRYCISDNGGDPILPRQQPPTPAPRLSKRRLSSTSEPPNVQECVVMTVDSYTTTVSGLAHPVSELPSDPRISNEPSEVTALLVPERSLSATNVRNAEEVDENHVAQSDESGARSSRPAALNGDEERAATNNCKLNIQRGTLKLKSNKLSEAVECFRKALDSIKTLYGADSPEIGKTHLKVGKIYSKRDYDKEALEELQRALGIFIKNGYSISFGAKKLWEVHDALAQVYNSLSKKEQSIMHYEAAIQVLTDSHRNPPERLHHIRNNLANAYREVGKLNEARAHLESAKREMMLIHTEPSLDMAKVHSSLGNVYSDLMLPELAAAELESCFRIRKVLCSGADDLLRISVTCKKLVTLYGSIGEKSKAQECCEMLAQELKTFRRNKERWDEMFDDTSGENRAAILYKLAQNQLDMENRLLIEEALELYKECLKMYQELSGDTLRYRIPIMKVHRAIGTAYKQLKNYRKSIEAYEQAKELLTPRSDAAKLKSVCNPLGTSYQEIGEFSKAEENILNAIRITEDLLADSEDTSLRMDLAGSHNNLGVTYQLWEKFDKSIHHLKTSLDMRVSLKDHSRKAALGEASSHRNLGNTFKLMKRLPEAIEHYEKELDVRKRLGVDTTRVTISLSHIYEEIGDIAKAEALLYEP
ncbi:tetratricopeptide repeat protein 28-like [Watersipora subatra]|uniref:tetratricopeptide repeat protein 28-like n=1 Tax=Watersipora subatra TaxID=2589382 RepID=UPI00355B3DE5